MLVRKIGTAILPILLVIGSSAPLLAKAPCRDAKGKFAKCAEVKKPQRCKDAKGRFAKCGTPGAKPVS